MTLSFVPGIVHGIREGLANIDANKTYSERVGSISRNMYEDFIRRWRSGDDDTFFY